MLSKLILFAMAVRLQAGKGARQKKNMGLFGSFSQQGMLILVLWPMAIHDTYIGGIWQICDDSNVSYVGATITQVTMKPVVSNLC